MQKTKFFRAVTFFCTVLMIFFGLTTVILSRNSIASIHSHDSSSCYLAPRLVIECLNMLPNMLTPLVLMAVFSAYEKRYKMHSFFWYLLCLWSTFMLITGITISIQYFTLQDLTRILCYKTELSANFLVSVIIGMAKTFDGSYLVYMSGTVTLAVCFS